eukprot:CAMPEP_0173199504 /NCGR_PEP_ID=MMETSP1141-20130122/17273_1 /TAXON_ID=483371 /ORGANISM="non described non described, Strain CCMP2298" /LENGTH=112 /DNA_ID=CAMNT_0014124403 /DNA_START=461 /DNA_END=795 /DNA_ORIENTATION=+
MSHNAAACCLTMLARSLWMAASTCSSLTAVAPMIDEYFSKTVAYALLCMLPIWCLSLTTSAATLRMSWRSFCLLSSISGVSSSMSDMFEVDGFANLSTELNAQCTMHTFSTT